MSEPLARKVGIVACSGEELAEGTVARLAALKVLNEMRPRETVTICLPLFLAGGAGDRAFARLYPTLTVDGCDLRCAARATEKFSGKPAAGVVVSDLVSLAGLAKPEGRRRLNTAGQQAVAVAAERLAALVDLALAKETVPAPGSEAQPLPSGPAEPEATCSCGSGVPVTRLTVNGQVVEVVALPLILQQFLQNGRGLDEASSRELFETVKIYNSVPAKMEKSYREAVLREYAAFCRRQNQP